MKKTKKSAILSLVFVLLIYFLLRSGIFSSSEEVEKPSKSNVQSNESRQAETGEHAQTEDEEDLDGDFYYFEYEVDRVVDGDTVILLIDGKKERVRLSGVDTPESVGDYEDHPEFYGKEASAFTEENLDGRNVYVEFDKKKRDKYDRFLAYIWTEEPNENFNGFFNAKLIEKGYAKWYNDRENKKYAKRFSELERNAKSKKIGLWARQ